MNTEHTVTVRVPVKVRADVAKASVCCCQRRAMRRRTGQVKRPGASDVICKSEPPRPMARTDDLFGGHPGGVLERLEMVALTNHTITDRDRLRRKEYLPALLRTAAAIEADLASGSPHARAR
jgi:hypothetical protein